VLYNRAMSAARTRRSATYTNPVYPRDLPDPFALRFNGVYYAFATGRADDGRYFPILSSRDLVSWEAHAGALDPLELEGAEQYWAPEVAYSEGRFYMYYAVGRDADPDHHLRLATAEHPLGPWTDAGVNLTPHEIFAIDAHPFRDPADGRWYLFYARDDLSPPYAGTGVVVDELLAMDRLAGQPREVIRPYADWQVFELQRAIKKNLDWYTVEGPFVLPVEGRYLCFYSGGRWENPNYGVAYALADHPLGPWLDDVNHPGPQVLTTSPGKVIGPGHNSVITGPDLLTPYLLYHGWDPEGTARYPRIDLLRWNEGRPACSGPTNTPQPAPMPPDLAFYFHEGEPGKEWDVTPDRWLRGKSGLRAPASAGRLTLHKPQGDCIFETGVRATDQAYNYGVAVGDQEILIGRGAVGTEERAAPLPPGFRPEAWHRMLVGKEGERLTITLDEFPALQLPTSAGPASLGLIGAAGTEFSHFALARLGAR